MSDRGYRVLVLGTSNAIYKDGYVPKLAAHPRISSLVNKPLGASSCLASAYLKAHIDFTDYDFCIIEYMTNENIYIDIDQVRSETVYNILLQLSSDAAKAGCIAIHLMLPSLWLSRPSTPYRDLSERLHHVCSMPFLDVYSLTKQLKILTGPATHDWFFMDDMHVSFPYCAHIAQIVGDSLDAIWEGKSSAAEVCADSPELKFFSATGSVYYNEGKVGHYKTSLIEVNTIDLDLDKFAVFDVEAKSLIGFICNNSMNFSAMRIISSNIKDYSFISEHVGEARPVITARPLFDCAPILNGRFIITAVPDAEYGIAERFKKFDGRKVIAANGQNGVSIVGFICDTGFTNSRYKIRNEPFNIADNISDEWISAIVDDARTSEP